ncbi:DNA polymerase III subunit gamma/tau [Novosphingobium decolorationis]|uniref:DNA polymerase III subunit gamma/tau n=1 Tax=Novosphingobium decolorationis TaxID=2698673 RepID=A0ABX8EC83_9SPHN|nr:DNA polymerase III subunit gamma/tau [Novosphingobium decolorationis]QVM85766.1 DNA polymerase III subunit gamma/tau [Novosphingobium decolorationis]
MDDSRENPENRPPWDDAGQDDPRPTSQELEDAGQASMFGDAPAQDRGDDANTAADGLSAAELEAAGQASMFGGEPAAPAEEAAPDIELAPFPAPAAPATDGAPSSQAKTAPAVASDEAQQPYRVLARKYRPQTFDELIGQEAMVRTLANAIKRDRLAHAFLMTGVRGVGKTSTARLIAKALNCIGPDGEGGPTIHPCGQCEPCRAIAEGRHIDVIEMDAASHTGVDDVREIIEAVRYAAVSARYKIYIIDEVHMLSRNAFNALLKTLEEPPAHVKFLFATTEVDKLPVTVLSRCQRFDLRRIPTPMLAEHFAKVCGLEGVEAEPEALAMVASAAEGSVRDGLSILDQAIAHADLDGEGQVRADKVRDMLGLSDKTVQRQLFAYLLEGNGAGVLEVVARQFALGVEPIALMRGQMDLAHRIALAQVSGSEPEAHSAEEREAIGGWATALAAGQVHRLWQLLLKGFEEVKSAPDPLVAAQMALLRIMHASDMPDPGSLVKKLEDLVARGPAPTQVPTPAPASPPASAAPSGEAPTLAEPAGSASGAAAPEQAAAPAPAAPPASTPEAIAPEFLAARWDSLVDEVEHAGGPTVANIMRMQVRVAHLAPGTLKYELAPSFREDISGYLRDGLAKATGQRWEVMRVESGGMPTIVERAEADQAAASQALRRAPLVEATLAAFPDAELIEDERPAAIGGGGRNWR